MFSFITRHRKLAVATTLVTFLCAAGAAFAYFSLAGNGSTTEQLGSAGNGTLTVTPVFSAGLVPGQTESLDADVTNNSSHATSIKSFSLDGVTVSTTKGGPQDPNCPASDFVVSAPTYTPTIAPAGSDGRSVAAGATLDYTGTIYGYNSGSVQFKDDGTDQSACENDYLTISLGVNGG